MEREKASYRTEEKEYGKVEKAEVKEAVVINYNSTIVATNPESNKVLELYRNRKNQDDRAIELHWKSSMKRLYRSMLRCPIP